METWVQAGHSSWLQTDASTTKQVIPTGEEQKNFATLPSRISAMRPVLAGGAPGLWASDHLAESRRMRGWQYIAIRTLSKGGASADTAVFRHIGESRSEKRRKRFGKLKKRKNKSIPQPDDNSAGGNQLRPVPPSHPLVRLLKKPNPEQSGAALRFAMIQQIALTGSALLWVVRNGFDIPVEIYIIPTGLAIPQIPSAQYPQGSYRLQPLGSWATEAPEESYFAVGAVGSLITSGAVLDARVVKAIRWPHPLYLSDGLSPLAAGAVTIDCAEQLDASRWYDFKNASNPGLVMEWNDENANPSDEDKAAFRADLNARNSGTSNTGKDLILPPGLSAKQISRSAEEMDYTSGYLQLRDTSLALHQVAPIAAGISEAGSYSAFYASLLQTTELGLQPILDLIAEELTEELGPAFGGGYQIKFKAKSINDPTLDEQRMSSDLSARALTINEWRAKRGLPKVPWGDAQVGTDMQLGKPPQPPPMAIPPEMLSSEKKPAESPPDDDSKDKPPAAENAEQKPAKAPDEDSTGIPNPTRTNLPKQEG